MMRSEWLPVLMRGSLSEIYVVDCQTLCFLQANEAALRNVQYSAAQLLALSPTDLARGLSHETLESILQPLARGEAPHATLDTIHTRRDGTTYPVELRLLYCASDAPAWIMIGNDGSARGAGPSAHGQAAKEIERTRIAREIHDQLGGNLTAIKMAMAQLKKRLPPEDAALAEKAAYVDTLVDRTIDATQRITVDLRPGILDFGLVEAVSWQAAEFEKQIGIPCAVDCVDRDVVVPAEVAAALFRVFQEALTNIAKHAQASRVTVVLHRDAGEVLLTVTDNGCGMEPDDRLKSRSFGLRGMEERVTAFGGDLRVAPAAGGGTEVAIRIPVPR